MKKIATIVMLAVAALTAKADYQMRFYTYDSAALSQHLVFDVDGTTKLSGSSFLGQLYTGTSAGSLSAIGSPTGFLTGGGAGFIELAANGGVITVTSATIFGGTSGFYDFRVWSAAHGANYETAAATVGAKIGSSGPTAVSFGGSPSGGGTPFSIPDANLHASFQLSTVAVPEPATLALGLFGAAGLLIRRRK